MTTYSSVWSGLLRKMVYFTYSFSRSWSIQEGDLFNHGLLSKPSYNISGERNCFEENYDYNPGQNLNSHPFTTNSPKECWNICQSFPQSKGFSWFKAESPHHSKGCYCKENIRIRKYNSNIISGPSSCTSIDQSKSFILHSIKFLF